RKPGRCGGDRHRAPAPGPRNRAHFGSAEGAYSRRHQGSACPPGGSMSGLTELGIWNDPPLRDALSWYVAVADQFDGDSPSRWAMGAAAPRPTLRRVSASGAAASAIRIRMARPFRTYDCGGAGEV